MWLLFTRIKSTLRKYGKLVSEYFKRNRKQRNEIAKNSFEYQHRKRARTDFTNDSMYINVYTNIMQLKLTNFEATLDNNEFIIVIII